MAELDAAATPPAERFDGHTRRELDAFHERLRQSANAPIPSIERYEASRLRDKQANEVPVANRDAARALDNRANGAAVADFRARIAQRGAEEARAREEVRSGLSERIKKHDREFQKEFGASMRKRVEDDRPNLLARLDKMKAEYERTKKGFAEHEKDAGPEVTISVDEEDLDFGPDDMLPALRTPGTRDALEFDLPRRYDYDEAALPVPGSNLPSHVDAGWPTPRNADLPPSKAEPLKETSLLSAAGKDTRVPELARIPKTPELTARTAEPRPEITRLDNAIASAEAKLDELKKAQEENEAERGRRAAEHHAEHKESLHAVAHDTSLSTRARLVGNRLFSSLMGEPERGRGASVLAYQAAMRASERRKEEIAEAEESLQALRDERDRVAVHEEPNPWFQQDKTDHERAMSRSNRSRWSGVGRDTTRQPSITGGTAGRAPRDASLGIFDPNEEPNGVLSWRDRLRGGKSVGNTLADRDVFEERWFDMGDEVSERNAQETADRKKAHESVALWDRLDKPVRIEPQTNADLFHPGSGRLTETAWAPQESNFDIRDEDGRIALTAEVYAEDFEQAKDAYGGAYEHLEKTYGNTPEQFLPIVRFAPVFSELQYPSEGTAESRANSFGKLFWRLDNLSDRDAKRYIEAGVERCIAAGTIGAIARSASITAMYDAYKAIKTMPNRKRRERAYQPYLPPYDENTQRIAA